jgi:hypothetical protein
VVLLRQVASVRTDPESGALVLVIMDDAGEREGITVPVDAFSMEQLGEVFGAMSSFIEGVHRAARDEQTRIEEERLAKERAIREAEEEVRRKQEEEEAARRAEEERKAEEARAQAEEEAKAFKEKILNMPTEAAKKAKDPILLQIGKEGLVMAVSRRTLYVVNDKAEMKTTEIKAIDKVAMGADGNSMVVVVGGERRGRCWYRAGRVRGGEREALSTQGEVRGVVVGGERRWYRAGRASACCALGVGRRQRTTGGRG